MTTQVKVYYGELDCPFKYKNGGSCRNKAYYSITTTGQYACGMHSKNQDRITLVKDPNRRLKERERLKELAAEVEIVSAQNKEKGVKGTVIVSKLMMFGKYREKKGFLNVFPNNKHQNRLDGFGCCSLSPMRLGPVEHRQPGLPPALNIENFHQGNKCFPSEVGDDDEPKKEFFETQTRMYNDSIPHRHKETASSSKDSKNIPAYSIWVRKDGTIKKCTYLESRQFYCTFYERLATQTDDFKTLKQKIVDGYNLNIVGYDGYDVDRSVEECYLDVSRPFGHELVLYTLLTQTPVKFPWRKYTTEEF